MLYVQTVITPENKTRYLLLDESGEIIQPVHNFLRYKDFSGKARNTLRSYCYCFKHFFDFLSQKKMSYLDVTIDDIAEFMRWVQLPERQVKVAPIKSFEPAVEASTVNLYVSHIMGFYDYQMRHEDYAIKLSDSLKKQISGSRRGFKDFLYHINKSKQFDAKILKLKVPKQGPKTLKKEQIIALQDACCNFRDKFLIQLLWETGMRIGEVLSLWLEDFEVDALKIHVRDRGELSNLAEIKTVWSPRVIDISSDLMNMYMDYLVEYHTDDVDTNHVFIKLSGPHRFEPLEYGDIDALFGRLEKKTGIKAHAHLCRHTHFDTLRKQGWSMEKIKKRGGWSNVQTPMNTYFHIDDEEMQDAHKKVEANIRLNKKAKEIKE